MRPHAALLATLLLVACAVGPVPGDAPPQANVLAISGVDVADGTTPELRRGWTVVVRDGRIAAAGPSRTVRVPRGAAVVDGQGTYVVPGLWDMHVHLNDKDVEWLPLLVAHGVTAARDVGALRRADADSLRREVAARGLPAPRILTAGVIVETPSSLGFMERLANLAASTPHPTPRWQRGHLAVTSAAEAVAAADSAVRAGASMLKFIDVPSREVYDALASAARAHGLTLVGHTPQALRAVGPWHALDAGQRSFEHLYGLGARASDSMSEASRAAFAARLRERNAALVPTLLVSGQDAIPTDRFWELVRDTAGTADPRNRWISAQERAQWVVRLEMLRDPVRPQNTTAAQRAYDHEAGALRVLHRLGAPVLPGTDLGMYLVYPGSSLHEELALLARDVGMSPFELLRAATLESARWAGVADSVGSVRAGQVADLVLLDADPLASAANLARVRAVVVGGRLYDRAALDRITGWRAR